VFGRGNYALIHNVFFLHFLCSPKENEAKERAPSTWPSAFLAKRLPAAVPQTRPDKSGLKQRGPFIRMHPLRSAALNGIYKNKVRA
jgi:hypothetical protein